MFDINLKWTENSSLEFVMIIEFRITFQNDQHTFNKSYMILVIYLVAHATVVTCLIAL